jgi:hypothetical protein
VQIVLRIYVGSAQGTGIGDSIYRRGCRSRKINLRELTFFPNKSVGGSVGKVAAYDTVLVDASESRELCVGDIEGNESPVEIDEP